jgi:hypothetical protein
VPVVSFDDPQGFPNIDMMIENAVKVYNTNGNLVVTETLRCGEGKCTGRWTEYDNDMWCKSSDGYTMTFEIRDKDGNWSAPTEIEIIGEAPSFYE